MATMEYVHADKARDDDGDLDDAGLNIIKIKQAVDKAYTNSRVIRLAAADDMVFAHVTQWDDNLLSTSDLSYRGEFNVLQKAIRQTIAELRSNPIQVQFNPVDDTTEDQAEFLDGKYRTDDLQNASQEAYSVAEMEAVVCGVGAYEMYTEYETTRGNNNKQVIKRAPIPEANNCVFWDPQSRLLDKSDAMWVGILFPYSKEAYEELAEQLTGEEHTAVAQSFSFPQYSFTFPWVAGNFDWIFVCTFYQRIKVDDVIITMQDPFGDTQEYYESDLKKKEQELLDSGHIVISSKECERWLVYKYICSGEKILSCDIIANDFIPVIPVYGERAFVEGQETWRGLVRLAKDPSRLRNFVLSYFADITSRSPRPKPLFDPRQIQGHEQMYIEGNNNYPYNLINLVDMNGQPLPPGPAGMMPEQKVPDSMIQLLQLTRDAVSDVASDALSRDFADINLSGDALAQLNNRIDQQTIIFQENRKHARRRDAEVYASFASRIFDTPQDMVLTLPDGTKKKDRTLKADYDRKTGNPIILNDLRNAQFDVSTEIGPSYSSQKEKLRREISTILPTLPPDDPMRMPLMLKFFEMIDGHDTRDLRKYARTQSILNGYKDPETPEEQQLVIDAQNNKQPDAATMMAQAEQMKGQAAMTKAQASMISAQADAGHKVTLSETERQNSDTNRLRVAVDAKSKAAQLNLQHKDAILTHAHNYMALQGKRLDDGAAPKRGKVHEALHGLVIMKHPVHGSITESDIQDTMAANGMTREQVMRKLKHHSLVHKVRHG